jgi:hypothetical protein
VQLGTAGAASATRPSARDDAAMATIILGSGTYGAVLFGGADSSTGSALGDTWIWDGSAWSQLTFGAGASVPPARSAAGMAWDSFSNTVVLFGGKTSGSANLGDTWVFDGTSWSQDTTCTLGCPSARRQVTMASDDINRAVLLFGGTSAGSTLGDTWLWHHGTGWEPQPPSSPNPLSRSQSVAAYDPESHGVVMFGGNHFDSATVPPSAILDDTWVWNGSDWNLQSPSTHPPARYEAAMAVAEQPSFDTVAILFGGVVSGTPAADTWQWDGFDWADVSPATSPPARSNAAMASAETDSGVFTLSALLFGGKPSSIGNDTWRFKP